MNRNLQCSLVILVSALTALTQAADRSPSYEDFAVSNIFKGKPASVDLKSHPEARHFRTELLRQTAEGPNFASHYRLVIWGCGTSCQQFAIVDCQTGHVYFPANLPYVTYTHYYGDDIGLQFRANSRLLIVNGSPKEASKTRRYYYLWQTNALRLLRSDLMK